MFVKTGLSHTKERLDEHSWSILENEVEIDISGCDKSVAYARRCDKCTRQAQTYS